MFSPFDLSEMAAEVADQLSLSGSETIAGRSAECLSVPFVEDIDGRADGKTEVCVGTELGVALRVRSESDEGVLDGYEATEVSGTVDTDLFEPPAEPIDMGDSSG